MQKLVGLHDYGVARSMLFPSSHEAWRWEAVQLASHHCLSDGVWCEGGHLLSNQPHLRAVGFVLGEA